MSGTVHPVMGITVIAHVHIVIACEFNIVRPGMSTPVPFSVMRLEKNLKGLHALVY